MRKQRFRIHKSDINTGKDRCGAANHFVNKCVSPQNPTEYLCIQLIEQVYDVDKDINEKILWNREKY